MHPLRHTAWSRSLSYWHKQEIIANVERKIQKRPYKTVTREQPARSPRAPTRGAASPAPANQRPLATPRAERVRPVRMRGAGEKRLSRGAALRHFLPQDGGPLGGTD